MPVFGSNLLGHSVVFHGNQWSELDQTFNFFPRSFPFPFPSSLLTPTSFRNYTQTANEVQRTCFRSDSLTSSMEASRWLRSSVLLFKKATLGKLSMAPNVQLVSIQLLKDFSKQAVQAFRKGKKDLGYKYSNLGSSA